MRIRQVYQSWQKPLLIGLGVMFASPVLANGDQWLITGVAASDWLYHGTTETDGRPVVGVNTEYNHRSGFFAGAQGHQARESGPRQRERALMGYVGVSLGLTDALSTTLAASRRYFLQSSKGWDNVEYSAELQHTSGLGLKLDYSPDYYEHNTRSTAVEVSYLHTFADVWYAELELGRLNLSNPRWLDHDYAALRVGRTWRAWSVETTAHWNSRGSDESFGRETYSDPGLTLQVNYRLW